ncbi:hypothetical protein ACOSP7_004408 [Xanthoceras sorbifolium]
MTLEKHDLKLWSPQTRRAIVEYLSSYIIQVIQSADDVFITSDWKEAIPVLLFVLSSDLLKFGVLIHLRRKSWDSNLDAIEVLADIIVVVAITNPRKIAEAANKLRILVIVDEVHGCLLNCCDRIKEIPSMNCLHITEKSMAIMDVKCQGCLDITSVFNHSQTVVVCGNCQTVLCQLTGGRARLTEGCSFRKKGD